MLLRSAVNGHEMPADIKFPEFSGLVKYQ